MSSQADVRSVPIDEKRVEPLTRPQPKSSDEKRVEPTQGPQTGPLKTVSSAKVSGLIEDRPPDTVHVQPHEKKERMSVHAVIADWLRGEAKRSTEWTQYIESWLASAGCSITLIERPNLDLPMENHARSVLFHSLRREIFCEIPMDTEWFRVSTTLDESWNSKLSILWPDVTRPVRQVRPVQLDRIVLWQHTDTPNICFVLEGNHRVMQWKYNWMHTHVLSSTPQTVQWWVGRSSSYCHWVHRHVPRLVQWHRYVYATTSLSNVPNGIADQHATIDQDMKRPDTEQENVSSTRSERAPSPSCLFVLYLALLFGLFGTFSMLIAVTRTSTMDGRRL